MSWFRSATILLVLIAGTVVSQDEFVRPCEHEIFCDSQLLHTVQMAKIFNDSKTFVDRPLRYPVATVLRNFNDFMAYHEDNPREDDLRVFVEYNFEKEGTEFDILQPPDWREEPAFISHIADLDFRGFGVKLHARWELLGRQMKPEVGLNPWKYTLVYVPHLVIAPGGRFREFYYWDSFWIQMGLLQSEMFETVEGMIRNFVYMVNSPQFGFVPNGGRIYYQRSQPPFLIPMVKNYYDKTNKLDFIDEVLPTLVKEFDFWLTNRSIPVEHEGVNYTMFRYNSMKNGPRPESYMEDFELAEHLEGEDKWELYSALHSGAESGIDFSSRWFVKNQRLRSEDLKFTSTRSFIPPDLNGLLHYNAKVMAEFFTLKGDGPTAAYYQNIANELATAINAVLWDETLGCWFDYNHLTHERHKKFYPTNVVPLWAGAQKDENVVVRVMEYLEKEGVLEYPGGIPSSDEPSGEQWDFPNAWAPHVDFVIQALERSGNAAASEKALELAQTWVSTNYIAFMEHDHMFEKYDVTELGKPGGGGEYVVVVGFGWTNGVILEYLSKYGAQLKAPELPRTEAPTDDPNAPTTEPNGDPNSATLAKISLTATCALLLVLSILKF